MKITPAARAWVKTLRGVQSGNIKLDIKVFPKDRSDGFHSLYDYDRAKILYNSLSPDLSYDSFFRKTDNFTQVDDVTFYRGVIISSYSHIDHLLDDLSYRIASTEHYRGLGKFCDRTEDKIKQVLDAFDLEGPLNQFSGRARSLSKLILRYSKIRNLSAHAVFSIHSSETHGRLVSIRNFSRARPSQGGSAMNDHLSIYTLRSFSLTASRIDRLARYLDDLHFQICTHLELPSGLLQIKAP